jgi:hypothetical protein
MSSDGWVGPKAMKIDGHLKKGYVRYAGWFNELEELLGTSEEVVEMEENAIRH